MVTSPTQVWRRRNGGGPYWELPFVLVLLITGAIVFDTSISRATSAGFSRGASFALSIAGVLAMCVTFFSFVGLTQTVDLLRSRIVAKKNWSIRSPALACLFAGLTTSLPMYYLVLWLAGI